MNVRRVSVWLILLATGALAGFSLFAMPLGELLHRWVDEPEYGHAFLIVACGGWIAWQRRIPLRPGPAGRGWAIPVLLSATLALTLGHLAALHLALQLAFLLCLLAVVIATWGLPGVRAYGFAIALLLLAIPLPYFVEAQLTGRLQLISTDLAVKIVSMLGIPVYQEGNIIDLGDLQLEVVEACSGLRYLYPLLSLGLLTAYFYRAPWWRRVLLVAATIPLTVLMNSLRIAITAVLADRYGRASAEGFFHDFEGWVIYLLCMAGLALFAALMEALFARRPLWQALDFDGTAPSSAGHTEQPTPTSARLPAPPPMLIATVVALAALAGASSYLQGQLQQKPQTANIQQLPLSWPGWQGRPVAVDQNRLSALKTSSHFMANYFAPGNPVPVNLYVAFYGAQTTGVSPHSPKVCIPGGGWNISRFEVLEQTPFSVNEVLIEKDEEKQLVHYWFVERGEPMVNEYRRKWRLLHDALVYQRTDGALVRVTTPVLKDETVAQARSRLRRFQAVLAHPVQAYLPPPPK